jgi:5-methylcytosine-specific restriction enzyme subunit McrC
VIDPIDLYAYQDTEVELDAEDLEFLRKHLSEKIRIRRPLTGQRYLLNPQQFVGVVALPSGRRLTSRSRTSASSLMYMLSVTYRLSPERLPGFEEFEQVDEIFDLIVDLFTDLVEERLTEGLHRDYTEVEENLHVVRGRIDFPRDITHNAVLRHRVYCWYSELTWDIPENQILRHVCSVLTGWPFRRPGLLWRLAALDGAMDEVSRRSFAADDVRSLVYHRMNEPYRHVHQLCALFLDVSSLSDAEGATKFRSFLIDMNRLFEEFVTQALRDRVRSPFHVAAQESRHHLGTKREVPLRPDLVIRRAGQVIAVADCKYKALEGGIDYRQHDYYQVLTYCTALATTRGILIYPRHEIEVEDRVRVRNSAILIDRLSIDIGLDPERLRAECDRLARRVTET